jgi:hypothetical protein
MDRDSNVIYITVLDLEKIKLTHFSLYITYNVQIYDYALHALFHVPHAPFHVLKPPRPHPVTPSHVDFPVPQSNAFNKKLKNIFY